MTEQGANPQTEPQGQKSGVLGKIIQWTILGLLLFTCIMAAIRKFS